MIRLALALALACTWLLAGCPDKTDQIGGAPKRQIDHVKEKMNEATEKATDRINEAIEKAEE
jgi:hypothetical protein